MNGTDKNNRIDLAGICYLQPDYLQSRGRINRLLDRYLSVELLSDRLSDISRQFERPFPRPWEPIDWAEIHPNQIVGIDYDLFLQVLAGATEIEAPIRDYAKESWDYLQKLHPQMARFMGGILDEKGSPLELGVWEKEERQHAPTFKKLYHLLSGESLQPQPNSVTGYHPSDNPWQDVYNHTVSRISTEWGATSVYLWLMAHSTGALQQAIAQPLQDEVNHLAKFWGFSRWAFSESYFTQLKGSTKSLMTLLEHHKDERTEGQDLIQNVLHLERLSLAVELTFTFTRVMVRLRRWNQELTPSYLRHLYGPVRGIDRSPMAA